MKNKHPLYQTLRRIRNVYKEKGCSVYGPWEDFPVFKEWALQSGWEYCPQDKMTLVRIDETKGFMPDNCRWTHKSEISAQNARRGKDKARKTMEERYGGWYTTTDEYKKKRRETCLEKYGVDHPMKTEEVKEKVRQTFREHGIMYDRNGEGVREWAEKLGISRSALCARIRKYGFDEAIKMWNRNIEVL